MNLLPCPFCGGSDIQDRGASGHYSVECACHRGGFETRLAAQENWNQRAPQSELAEARVQFSAQHEPFEIWRDIMNTCDDTLAAINKEGR